LSVAVGVLVVLLIVAYVALLWPDRKLERDAKGLIGESEAAVLVKLGSPEKILFAADITAIPNEKWWGTGWYPAPDHPVTNKVLLYYRSVTGVLIYIDSSGNVEWVHVVGT
jgi:hypothetical protein